MSETRATIRARAQKFVGTAMDTTLNEAIREAHKTAMRRHNWRFQEATSTMSILAGASTFSLPSDWKAELNPEMSDEDGSGYRRMTKIIKAGIEARDTDDDLRPLLYRIWQGQGTFPYTADDDYTFSLEYYAWLPEITADTGAAIYTTDNQAFIDEIHKYLEWYAISQGYLRHENYDAAALWDSKAADKLAELIADDEDIALAAIDLKMEIPG